MVGQADAIEDSATLYRAPAPGDAIHVQKRRVRSQAGPQRRVSVVFRPLKDSRQAVPIWFVLQVRCPRLSAGNDETIELAAPQAVDVRIELLDALPAPVVPRNIGQRVKGEVNQDTVSRRSSVKDREALAFARLKRPIRPVVDQPDVDASAGPPLVPGARSPTDASDAC